MGSLHHLSQSLLQTIEIDGENQQQELPLKVYVNDKSYIATPYEKLIEKHGDAFHELTYDAKCETYFDALYSADDSWEIHDFSNLPYDKAIFETRDHFIKHRINEYISKLDPKLTNEQRENIIKHEQLEHLYTIEYQKAIKDAYKLEQQLIDSMTHLRAYGACFLDQYGPFTKKFGRRSATIEEPNDQDKPLKSRGLPKAGDSLCGDIEMRMFQWLTQTMPTYTRWDGQTTNTIPNISDYITQDELYEQDNLAPIKTKEEVEQDDNGCFFKKMRDSLNGRGLVISAADSHAEQLASLLGSLRATGNKLPIQVVHAGDLSKDVIEGLVDIARNIDSVRLKKVEFLDEVLVRRNITIQDKTKPTPEELSQLFPQQEIWFVDISQSVSKKYKEKFSGYGNKLLAFFFNSFQHSILIDTDTVPMVDFDQYILKSPFFLEKGAYFFRDRELFSQIKRTDSYFYEKLMPSLMDTAMFGIPSVTEFTLNNRFMKERFDHYMESGVVAIDRKKHFTGVIATVQLQLWRPVTSRVWGDKELFWLALTMAGDEEYFMNRWPAGAAGVITPKEFRLSDDKDDSRRSKLVGNELCSTHPAHISSEDNSTLLWFNSGFTYCKYAQAADKDITTPLFKTWYKSKYDLKKMYINYHKIDSVIIPKAAEFHVKDTGSGENERGWIKGSQCTKFLYCAYDRVGGGVPEGDGLLINFDEDQRKLHYFYGSVNRNAIDIFQT